MSILVEGNHDTQHPPFLTEGGELGALMREFPWEQTPLGAPGTWPLSLKTAVRILLTSRQPMFVWWGDELINIYNDPYRAILGGKHPAALGQPASVVWKEIWDQIQPRVRTTITRNQGTYDEALFLMMERNGYPEETYYTFSYSPLPNDQGQTSGIFCANTDETQRILSSRRTVTLRELAARAADAQTIAGACKKSIEGLAINPRDLPFVLLYLRPPGAGDATLMAQSGALPEHSSTRFADPDFWPLDQVLRSAATMTVNLPKDIPFPSGAWDRSPDTAVLLPIESSGQVGYRAVLVAALNPHCAFDAAYQDFLTLIAGQITSALRTARAYEEERKRAEALEELDRAKTAFFSNISHEFRTPLTLMLGPVEDLLRQHSETSSADRDALEIVHRNAVRLQKLVNALLDFSRIEAGRMAAQFEPTDLAVYTAELASAFRSAMQRAGLDFTVECPPLSQLVPVDREMWEKIVLNLLSNALKYTFEGGVTLRLTEQDGCAKLSVSDTGTGIPEAELPRLFERFHRVAGARGRTFEGTGIGLAMVHDLVALHAGTVSVASRVGEGSIFSVSLPFGVSDKQLGLAGTSAHRQLSRQADNYVEEALGWLPQQDGSASQPRERATGGCNGRILLADDNTDMRSYLARLLSAEYEVTVASNGREALTLAVDTSPDLVLTDVMMPELDGFGLLRELRANPATRSVPVVFLSARAGEEASAEGREAGADDYIVKPFTARELLARVTGTLLIHRERRHAAEQLYQAFEQAPVAICVLRTPDYVYELANPFYQQLVRGRKIIGEKITDVLPNLPERVWQAFHQVIDLGEPFLADDWHIPYDADGDGQIEDHWFNVAYSPLRNSDGSIRGLVAVLHDVTSQVQSRIELERVNRELEEFAYVASHDLQEPLRMVNTYSQLLIRRIGNAEPDQLEKYVGFISTGVSRMEELIRDLLSFARTVQRERPALEPVSLRAGLDRALEILHSQIETKKAIIHIGELPRVMGDESQVPQLFQNLISNALKYSKAGVIPEIHISAQQSDAEWTVSIRDNGIGFKQEYAERIFGLFKRLHKDEYEGTGLGLAICQRIVERFGGRIWANSRLGEGSTFSFTVLGER